MRLSYWIKTIYLRTYNGRRVCVIINKNAFTNTTLASNSSNLIWDGNILVSCLLFFPWKILIVCRFQLNVYRACEYAALSNTEHPGFITGRSRKLQPIVKDILPDCVYFNHNRARKTPATAGLQIYAHRCMSAWVRHCMGLSTTCSRLLHICKVITGTSVQNEEGAILGSNKPLCHHHQYVSARSVAVPRLGLSGKNNNRNTVV